jgi:hypothetical protein
MKPQLLPVALCLSLSALADGPADNIPDKVRSIPPKGAAISAHDRQELDEGVTRLGKEIDSLRDELKNKPAQIALLPDVQIFHNAVRYALRYDEIFNPTNEIPAAKAAIKTGLDRADQLRQGKPSWISATGLVARGYISKLDDSIQPYGLVVPSTYQPGTAPRFRLDFWFHGRDEKLTELNFITQRQKSAGEFTPPNTIVLHTYSRFCNGQKFAGEVDAFEALDSVRSRYPIDDNRLVVRGFSLGGAACWHMAVHHAGLWAAAAPGAGFSETADFLKIFQNEPVKPTWYEQKLWHLYDATDYALNLFNCPTVAYSGEIDRQKQAADIMAKSLSAEGIQLTHIIGPQTAHKYHPQAKEEINRRIDSIAALGRNPAPRTVRFTTWTLRYNRMHWIVIDALDQHWERARVDAELDEPNNSVKVATKNVSALSLSFAPGACPLDLTKAPTMHIDGRKVIAVPVSSDRSWTAHFKKDGRSWAASPDPASDKLAKRHGLQGPIDDAFLGSFLIVRPTGKPLNDRVGAWVLKELARATNEWRRQFRGEARVKDDTNVSDEDIAAHNLILWGDPASNQLLSRITSKLPLAWNEKSVGFGSKKFPGDHHAPILIYPNPLNPKKYLVLNSGFTFREYDYLSNARQVAKLPDYAIVDISAPISSRAPGGIVDAGFFGERWELTSATERK